MNENAFDFKEYLTNVLDKRLEQIENVFKFSSTELTTYKVLLYEFISINSSNATTNDKGKSLEDIVITF